MAKLLLNFSKANSARILHGIITDTKLNSNGKAVKHFYCNLCKKKSKKGALGNADFKKCHIMHV